VNFKFPLQDVRIEITPSKRVVTDPLYSDGYFCLNQQEFSMDVKDVANFYVSKGEKITVYPYTGADHNTIELYLNGSAYGAILHQRRILPIHGSCFSLNGMGVMICGEAGAGKSSLTASFCLSGDGEFLTDDVTPIVFKNGKPLIRAASSRIKLWKDTLEQLQQKHINLQRVDGVTDKFYYPVIKNNIIDNHRLDVIFIFKISERQEPLIDEITGGLKVLALRNEIYRSEYLRGMPENEVVYFSNLLDIARNTRIFNLGRPLSIKVSSLKAYLGSHLKEIY
jgi:hypothetical protein